MCRTWDPKTTDAQQVLRHRLLQQLHQTLVAGKYNSSQLQSPWCEEETHFTPCVEYAAHPTSANTFQMRGGGWMQYVLQCRVEPEYVVAKRKPGLLARSAESIAFQKQFTQEQWDNSANKWKEHMITIHPNYKNDSMEWVVKTPTPDTGSTGWPGVTCFGILCRRSEVRPDELPASRWWQQCSNPTHIQRLEDSALANTRPSKVVVTLSHVAPASCAGGWFRLLRQLLQCPLLDAFRLLHQAKPKPKKKEPGTMEPDVRGDMAQSPDVPAVVGGSPDVPAVSVTKSYNQLNLTSGACQLACCDKVALTCCVLIAVPLCAECDYQNKETSDPVGIPISAGMLISESDMLMVSAKKMVAASLHQALAEAEERGNRPAACVWRFSCVV